MRASNQGRRFLAYFFGAVAKELGRQQAKLENKKGNKRSALKKMKNKSTKTIEPQPADATQTNKPPKHD